VKGVVTFIVTAIKKHEYTRNGSISQRCFIFRNRMNAAISDSSGSMNSRG